MRNFMVAASLLFAIGAGGCGNKGDKFDQALDEMSGIRDKMCACKDKDCATKVADEYSKWKDSMGEKIGDTKPNPDQDKKGEAMNTELKKCRDALLK